MRDLRRRALECNKTVSKKAQSRVSRASPAANPHAVLNNQRFHQSDGEGSTDIKCTNWSAGHPDEVINPKLSSCKSERWKQNIEDCMSKIVDRKKYSARDREINLAQYVDLLTSYYVHEAIQYRNDEIYPILMKIINSEHSENETCHAMRAVALTMITVPSESVYEKIEQYLKRSYRNSDNFGVKVAAIRTLSTVAIYGAASEFEISEIMDEYLEIIETDGCSIDSADQVDVVVAACKAWGYLATFLDDLEQKAEFAIGVFAEQLDSSDVSVKVAAGENIALLYEKGNSEALSSNSDCNSEEYRASNNPTQSKYSEANYQKSRLHNSLNRLANESSRHICKKDRKTLHSNFSDILNTIEHPNRGPRYQNAINKETGKRYGSRMTITINNMGDMKIDKWWKMHRLHALRTELKGGFSAHYRDNPVIFESLPLEASDD
ncbi:Bgt-5150 [Blumeria graminis f. sp. tritici]|uniref:Bgt-5150 n=2 Tax=Blumeria graminis f. sp. tritici TaxID=62690 RepID=A0A9X9QFL3_BLUGR|nr:hypothetical protein BGT96224_5150 [Blumeria graminis f. sp. tritici 96224]VDB93185.1 Bgt-5150 [Blumeria graminis f. sp. tritici]